VILKIALTAGYDMCSGENRPVTEKKRQIRNSDAAFGTIYIISKKMQAEALYFFFSFIRQPKN
jgi:hypothetical protein